MILVLKSGGVFLGAEFLFSVVFLVHRHVVLRLCMLTDPYEAVTTEYQVNPKLV